MVKSKIAVQKGGATPIFFSANLKSPLPPRDFQGAICSGDSETNFAVKISTILRFPPNSNLDAFSAQNEEISYRWCVSFGHIGNVFCDSVRACLECARRVRARAGLYRETIPLRIVQFKKIAATLGRASRENYSRAQKPSVWLYLSRCITARNIPLFRGPLSRGG